jgi:tetratricopeptide (TPR) repeat protein
LGDVQAALTQHAEAIQSYHAAIAACDTALLRAPEYVVAHHDRGLALQRLGDMQAALGQDAEAIQSLEAALASYSQSLDIAPNNERIRKLRDHLQEKLRNIDNR